VFPFAFRRAALLALRSVAEVHAFDEDEPLALLARLQPPLHIKGGSRDPARVRHEEELLARWGGKVAFCPLVDGYSTSDYLAQTRRLNRP
jgi:bifunctional ADP-heptose synthase (sugar kinase/adenylyltransferase)